MNVMHVIPALEQTHVESSSRLHAGIGRAG
jgi:hypothetical protein